MRDSLNFVRGAIAKKDLVPVLQHFRVRRGRVTGFNGILALSAPIPLDLDVAPHAGQLVRAVNTAEEMEETAALQLVDIDETQGQSAVEFMGRKLLFTAGGFKTFIDCADTAEYPELPNLGKRVKLTRPILPALRSLAPFVGEDASRPWCRSVLIRNSCAYATNNVVLVQRWLEDEQPEFCISSEALTELLRIGEEPTHLQLEENAVTFHFGPKWLRAQLPASQWPDVDSILERSAEALLGNYAEIFEACEKLEPFTTDQKIYLCGGCYVSTTTTPETSGSSVRCEHDFPDSCYNVKQLLALRGFPQFNFNVYPDPVPFCDSYTRGIILGVRI